MPQAKGFATGETAVLDFYAILKKREMINRANTSEAGLPVFREAVPAIDGPSLSWLERYFALFAAV